MPPNVFLRINLFLFLSLVTACSSDKRRDRLPYYNTPDFNPVFFGNEEISTAKVDHRIGSFSFTDQHGKSVTDKDLEGKIHVACFMFTSCISICPVMTKNIKLLQQDFADSPDFKILSYSVTPWIDTVGRLHEYARENGIKAGNWHFLTGNKGQIYELARKSYFAEEELGFTRDSTEFLHTEHILLVDKTRRIRGIYNGTLELEIRQLADDIRTLLSEGSN